MYILYEYENGNFPIPLKLLENMFRIKYETATDFAILQQIV